MSDFEQVEMAESARELAARIDRKRASGTVILTNSLAAAVQLALENAASAHDLLAEIPAASSPPTEPTNE